MKKLICLALIIFTVQFSFAKKVKFAVDMSDTIVSPNGVHLSCDFQAYLGQGQDFTCDSLALTKETVDTNIWSVVVDIPAFAKYEFNYVNGNQCYETEAVPYESQAWYNNSDHRWIYIDSLADDTTFLAPVLFTKNAPAGLTLIRFRINMQQETVSPTGVHVAGDFQGWDPAINRLYSFGNDVYEWIAYQNLNTYNYKFYNGNSSGTVEVVPSACAISGNRNLVLAQDTVLPVLCFSTCNICFPTGLDNLHAASMNTIYPNPMSETAILSLQDHSNAHNIFIFDMSGRKICTVLDFKGTQFTLSKNNFAKGIYVVQVENKESVRTSHKLIVE